VRVLRHCTLKRRSLLCITDAQVNARMALYKVNSGIFTVPFYDVKESMSKHSWFEKNAKKCTSAVQACQIVVTEVFRDKKPDFPGKFGHSVIST
jgi:hypothetical protein